MQLKTTPAERADYQRVVAKSYPHSLTCRLVDDVATLRKRCEELEKYAAHFPTCNVRLTNFDPVKAVCDCGLDQLLQKGPCHDAAD